MCKEIDGTEFACLTINAFLEEENKELMKRFKLFFDTDMDVEKRYYLFKHYKRVFEEKMHFSTIKLSSILPSL